MCNRGMSEDRALSAVAATGVSHTVLRHGRVAGIEEAAQARGVAVAAVVKTIVVRRGEDDYVLVLVPGDRTISWPRLRAHLGVRRVSMPSADEAWQATGYVRGSITPFGATRPWPVVADTRLVGREITVGGGAPGVAVLLQADDAISALGGSVADVTDPATAR